MKKILVIKHGALGDIILSMYPLFSLKKNYKNHSFTILTESKYFDLFRNIPFVDNIKVDNRKSFFSIFTFIKLSYWFYKQKFEWVFDLQTSKRTNIYFYFFSIFSEFKWSGIAKKCSHPHLDSNRTRLHTIERHKQQLMLAGVSSYSKVDWSFLQSDIKKFSLSKNLCLLIIGGAIHRPKKRWNIENFIKLIKLLNVKQIIPIIIGGNAEKKYFKKIQFAGIKYKNLIGKTSYLDLAEIARKSKWVVGNDTGPMHLICQCSKSSTKKIVLFGSDSDPKLCAPIGKNVFIVKKKNINAILPKDIIKIMTKKKDSIIN
tara:strand:+ start:216 stop:1163 length:948 start_codon:yes stop_codon:yes gene_type:complete